MAGTWLMLSKRMASAQRTKRFRARLDACPCCGGRPAEFKWRGVRKRLFLALANWVVERVWSYLPLWKCPLCQQSFTDYPPFALPFKRYALPFIQTRCASYVEDEARTYDEGVKEGGEQISHEDMDKGAKLWPSTLWRWVTTLGNFPAAVREALALIKQKAPSTGLFRALGEARINESKFRSVERKLVLHRCRELMLADRVYRDLFGTPIFPELAMAVGFR